MGRWQMDKSLRDQISRARNNRPCRTGVQKSAWNVVVNWHKSVKHQSKISPHRMGNHQITKDDFEIVCEVADECAQNVFSSQYNARIGRPAIICTVEHISSSCHEVEPVCDEPWATLISYLKSSWDHRQFVMSEIRPVRANWVLFQKPNLLETSQIQGQHRVDCSANLVIVRLDHFHRHAENTRQCHTAAQRLR